MSEEPVDFIQDLIRKTQLLACLQWLNDFQVIACVPIDQRVAFQDVADLAGVPVAQLTRIVRMTATTGFLYEPQTGYVAHSNLSTQFVQKPSLFDTIMFVSETGLPAALQMPQVTRLHGDSNQAHHSGWSSAFHPMTSFPAACENTPKLQRQSAAFERLWSGSIEDNITDALSSLAWSSLGEATVVEVGPQSVSRAVALAKRAPKLRFIVQLREDAPKSVNRAHRNGMSGGSDASARVSIQNRSFGAPQSVGDAVVYILHLPTPSLLTSMSSTVTKIIAELRAHFNILRANSAAHLILVARLLPEPGAVDAEVESIVRLQDLQLFQITNDHGLEMPQFIRLLHSVRDDVGRLTIVNTLSSRRHFAVVFEVRIQADSARCE